MRLYNEKVKFDAELKNATGGLKFIRERDEAESHTYKALKFVGVGGLTGKEEIWDKSLLAQLKAISPNGIKLAVGITMYQEDFT